MEPRLGMYQGLAGLLSAYCYAARVGKRMGWPAPDHTGTFGPHQGGPGRWPEIRLHPERLGLPLSWRKPRRVFVTSLGDLFHAAVPFDFIRACVSTMEEAGWHTFQILTKRPKRAHEILRLLRVRGHWPLPNVWLGVSVENQRMADRRIPGLLETSANVRFVSCEPLLGPLDLTAVLQGCAKPLLDWVIVGGESGGSARRRLVSRCPGGPYGGPCRWPYHAPCNGTGWLPRVATRTGVASAGSVCRMTPGPLAWVRSLRDQTLTAGVPFFFKQWGGPTPRAGGHLLDGRVWDQLPSSMALAGRLS